MIGKTILKNQKQKRKKGRKRTQSLLGRGYDIEIEEEGEI